MAGKEGPCLSSDTQSGETAENYQVLEPEQEEEVLNELRLAAYADSIRGSLESRRRAVCHLTGRAEDSIEVCTETLEGVAARFKEAGYRSGLKYLLEAKKMHIECGHRWDAKLDLCMRACRRSLETGIGAPRKAGELRLTDIAGVPDEKWEAGPEDEGPYRAKRSWLIACFWVLREIELANIRIRDVDLEGYQ